jgi:folate-binding protein YgfZ
MTIEMRMEAKAQVEAARRAVLAVRAEGLATLVVTGKDRVSWLNGLVTCDLVKRPEGEARYGLVVARNGRVIADVTVVVEDARVLVVVPGAVISALVAHFEHYLVMEDAEIAPRTDAFEPWMLHGPRAVDVLAAARPHGGVGGGVDRTGLGGAVVLAPTERASEVRAAIERAVVGAGGVVGDESGWEALRLERGVPVFAADFDDKTYPQEASLEKVAVSFDKGCYLGQEVVCMLEMRGHVKRKLASIVLDSVAVPLRGAIVTDEVGAELGAVTSAALSPTLGKAVALAMVKRSVAEPGSHMLVDGSHAEVVGRPA